VAARGGGGGAGGGLTPAKRPIQQHTDATGEGFAGAVLVPLGEVDPTGAPRKSRFSMSAGVSPLNTTCKAEFLSVDKLVDPKVRLWLSVFYLPHLGKAQAAVAAIEAARGAGAIAGLRASPGPGFTPLDWACRKGHLGIVRFLVVDPRTRGLMRAGAPVAWACHTGRVECARAVVAAGGSVNATSACSFGKPPLLLAAENGSLRAMQWLQGVDFAAARDPGTGRGVLVTVAAPGSLTTPAHTARAKWARLKGAVA